MQNLASKFVLDIRSSRL